MRNMNVAKKLISGFCIVAFACAVVGVVGIFGMSQIKGADTMLYEEQTKPLADIAKILEYSQRLRTQARNAIIYTGNSEMLKTVEATIKEQAKELETYITAYDPTIKDEQSREAFDEAKEIYYSIYRPAVEDVLENAKGGMDQEALSIKMENAGAATATMDENFTLCMSNKIAGGEAAVLSNSALYTSMLTIIIVVIIGAIAIAVLLAIYISGIISKPLNMMSTFLNRFGSAGNLQMTAEDEESYAKRNRDEIGFCQEALGMVVFRLQDISEVLNKVADGDLTVSLETLSEKDSLGLAVNKMATSLNRMFEEINASADQVTTGAKQIADGAQALAQGTTEQASAMEELSSSISEISQKTKDNAQMAGQAADLTNTIMSNAEKGNRHMNEMISAVKEINEASQNISKVIKVIDDIAFQTNILALNAAVEAARAGQHGKGFAVVAEEVRTLAAKSGEAAKDTGGLIANSMEKAEFGVRIAGETAASLTEIVSGVNEAGELIEEIAKSSDEQSAAISQINLGIDQVAQVIQQNSATAEESAAASEEMSSQANILEELVKRFKLKDSNMDSFKGLPDNEASSAKHTEEMLNSLNEEGEEFGKD